MQDRCTWLTERLDKSLHPFQCTCLAYVVKKIYSEYELQGMEEERLNSGLYQQIEQRMTTEEATCALTNAENAENGGDQEDQAAAAAAAAREGAKAAEAGAQAAAQASKMLTKGFGKAFGSLF